MSLSDKRMGIKGYPFMYDEDDVKEFIKSLKEEVRERTGRFETILDVDLFKLIDKLAGEELI